MKNSELEAILPAGINRYANELLLLVGNYTKKIADEAYRNGYLEGYQKGQGDKRAHQDPPNLNSLFLSMSVERLSLPTYVKNALIRNGCTNLGDIISLKAEQIRRIPKLGPKGIRTIAQLLRVIEIQNTDWEPFAD